MHVLSLVTLCHLKVAAQCVWPSERFLKACLAGPKGRCVSFYSDDGVGNFNAISSYLLLENCSQGKPFARISDSQASLCLTLIKGRCYLRL